MAEIKGTKKLARDVFFKEYKKTGEILSGYSLSKIINCNTRSLCKYSAEFRLELTHRKKGLAKGELDEICFTSCFERNRLIKEIIELNQEILRLTKAQ